MSIIIRSVQSMDDPLIQSFCTCYQEVFAAAPWNEIGQWPPAVVKKLLQEYLSQPGSVVLLAVLDEKVVGFCMGRSTDSQNLSTELDLELPESLIDTQIHYLKDLGVLPAQQLRGLASRMLKELQATAEKGSWLLARTMGPPEPTILYYWFLKAGYQNICSHQSGDNRVILGKAI